MYGFTLVELLIAMTLTAVIGMVLFSTYKAHHSAIRIMKIGLVLHMKFHHMLLYFSFQPASPDTDSATKNISF